MLDWITNLLRKTSPSSIPKTSPSSIPKVAKFDPVAHVYDKELCPCCDRFQPFLSGPSGGMSVNVMCKYCGTRLNLTPVLRRVEWTHGPQSKIWGGTTASVMPDSELIERRKVLVERAG